jgi:adenine-specific DNA-methyltransferase
VLHWANKDQYYIKTEENFKNYSFKVGEYTVEFLIREAEGTTNNKTKKRFFLLTSSADNLDYDDPNKTLTIFFEYRGLSKDEEKEYGKKNEQEVILAKIKDEIITHVEDSGLKASLTKVVSKSKDTERSLIEKHLRTYTKKNTTDYFIHKDLKGFLVGELDFYIKNEVFHLDDLGTDNELSVEQYVTRAKVVKNICLKIIDFLAQIEDFQKMLFEKKKFVVKTDYCMTLDNVPEELYPEIVKNENQLNEWNILYEIGEEKQSTLASFGNDGINEAYLKENPYLVIDTKFFGLKFKDMLLSSFDDIDEAVDGLMINSENWQALNLMQEKYREKIKCIYIDPPYNTDASKILYKNDYEHSSWLSLMSDRLVLAIDYLNTQGIMCITIDDYEFYKLRNLLDAVFRSENILGLVAIKNNPSGRSTAKGFSIAHEYAIFAAKSDSTLIGRLEHNEKQKARYDEKDERGFFEWTNFRKHGGLRTDAETMYFPFYATPTKLRIPEMELNDEQKLWVVKEPPLEDETVIFPIDENGEERRWKWGLKRCLEEFDELKVDYDKNRELGVYVKTRINEEGTLPLTWWDKKQYSATSYGTNLLQNIFGKLQIFTYPKSIYAVEDCLKVSNIGKNDIVLDFFAGSGTTAHAVLNLNKNNDETRQKYILVETNEYFDTIMKPRIQKVMYSSNWKNGKPLSNDGISHIFKYQSLEQYEDTLNNIEFRESGSVQRTFADMGGYFLRYMLDFETREGSPCRFNVEKLTKPFDYTLKIAQGNELKDETVDLVETFNYLLGIHVKQVRTFNNNGTYYKLVLGKKDEDEIAIIWRDTEKLDLIADKTFIEEIILGKFKPTKTYINSDFYVERAIPIELEFKKLMVV